jgi:hypothetical protein
MAGTIGLIPDRSRRVRQPDMDVVHLTDAASLLKELKGALLD